MKKQLSAILAVVMFIVSMSGCNSADMIPPNSDKDEIIPETTTTSGLPTPAPVPVLTPDPASVSLKIEPAYPKLSFDQPLYYTVSNDAGSDVYVVERTGRIKVYTDSPDTESAEVFLDISNLVNHRGQEQGLLGLAFHPDYIRNGYFYVNYTSRDNTVIARYTRQKGNDRAADPNSGLILLSFQQPYANHNGGHLAFGPDGYLYIATGDGGSGGDPQNNAQNPTNLLGKILRIDVDHTSDETAYGIPVDNPFVGNSQGYRPEIYAYGLRNPWRFSFDNQGRLWAADVGQDKIEEIDLIVKGGNYGWRLKEGTRDYKMADGIDLSSLIPPVWEYDHSQGQSVTGGYVYEGNQIPALQGAYIYGDFISGRIWALWIDDKQTVHNELILETDLKIASFGINANKELLIADLRGKIYRLIEAE